MAATILGLGIASAAGIYLLEQKKSSLPIPVQTILGARVVHVRSNGMYPTLKPGDYASFDTRAYVDHPPQRGDIVLLLAPDGTGLVLIKRVIAIPGDRVLIANGVVGVNGRTLDEPYVTEAWTQGLSWPSSGQAQLIPSDQYFVLGDNRDHSNDSRAFGTISRNSILGKLLR